jgi:hypothetical protein
MPIYTEDLTKLISQKIKVECDERAVIRCTSCSKKFTIPSAVVSQHCGEVFLATCSFCTEKNSVKFEINRRNMHSLRISITNISNNQTYDNITVQQLTSNHINLIIRGQHNFRKGQKVRINIIDPHAEFSKSENNAVAYLVRGKYLSCRFTKALDRKFRS